MYVFHLHPTHLPTLLKCVKWKLLGHSRTQTIPTSRQTAGKGKKKEHNDGLIRANMHAMPKDN